MFKNLRIWFTKKREAPKKGECHAWVFNGLKGRGHRSDDSNVRFASIDRVRFACDVCKQTREYATIPINRFSEEYQNLANLLIEEVFGEEPPERIDPGEIVYNILDVIATRKRIPL